MEGTNGWRTFLRGSEGMKPLDEDIDQAVNAALPVEKYRK